MIQQGTITCNLSNFVIFRYSENAVRNDGKALQTTAGGQPHLPKGDEAMRITFHIGEFTITIVIKKRKNRHPDR